MGGPGGLKVWISQAACSKALDERMDEQIKINEIFFSIQGESSWAGHPTVFVRTSGCHLRCTYCDTKYAYHEGHVMNVEDIVAEIRKYPTEYVCVTGGEPLLQKGSLTLMKRLCDLGFNVSLETSGDKDCGPVDVRVKKIIDVKTPDSGASGSFADVNLQFADGTSEFKFVICSENDFVWAENFANEKELFKKSNVLYSPSFKIVNERWLAEKILAAGSRARMQLQMHKYIWPSDARGV
jgi:7-carboxy-7-deazaguanine synthase